MWLVGVSTKIAIMSHIQVAVDPVPGLLGNVRSRKYSTVVSVLTTCVQIGKNKTMQSIMEIGVIKIRIHKQRVSIVKISY